MFISKIIYIFKLYYLSLTIKIFLNMTKETLLQILNLSQTKQITEKEACKQILQTEKRQDLAR